MDTEKEKKGWPTKLVFWITPSNHPSLRSTSPPYPPSLSVFQLSSSHLMLFFFFFYHSHPLTLILIHKTYIIYYEIMNLFCNLFFYKIRLIILDNIVKHVIIDNFFPFFLKSRAAPNYFSFSSNNIFRIISKYLETLF